MNKHGDVLDADFWDRFLKELEADELLEKLKAEKIRQLCHEVFDLHGSRFFAEREGNYELITEETDWDFFCPDGENFTNLLEENDFVSLIRNPEYLDVSTSRIWFHPFVPDIQVVQKCAYNEYKQWRDATNYQWYKDAYHKGSLIAAGVPKNKVRELIRGNLHIWFEVFCPHMFKK